MSEFGKKLQMGAYFSLAGGFLLSAWALYENAKDGSGSVHGLGEGMDPRRVKALPSVSLKREAGKRSKGEGKPQLKQYDIADIDTRVGLIGELIRKGSLNPDLRETTVKLLSQKCNDSWCVKEKDCLGEVRAIFNAIRDPKSPYAIRYVRDAMLADVFTAPERTLFKSHGGDCDDYVITLGSMLMSVGHPVRLRVIATRDGKTPDDKAPWSHIYLLTPTTFDNPNAKWTSLWISVDGSMDRPLGWEAPGAKDVAKTGKPSGITARVRDYTLLKPSDGAGT